MGTVYKAEHRLMGRLVALKIVSPELANRPAVAERFRREVRAAAQLRHPNIVHAYDADQAGGTHFLVMEFVEGTDLGRLVAERGPLPVAQACDYARQAALGLQHAFELGLVHRDIKPSNLMLTPQGQVKVLDFGLARCLSEILPALAAEAAGAPSPAAAPPEAGPAAEGPTVGLPAPGVPPTECLTTGYVALGTADYVAPEVVWGPAGADIRADIYSLGCTLYRFLAGQVPFPGGDLYQKVRAHRKREPRPLAELRPDAPPEVVRVVERMMAKDPAARYQTPAEVAEGLAPCAGPARQRLLVVDDDPALRGALRLTLEREGYTVRTAANGREALAEVRARPPDIILLDLVMPVMDGWQFLQELRADPALTAIPVILVSAASREQARAVVLGVAEYLQKPVAPEEVAARLQAHRAEGATGPPG
jgi:serine/threonine protein kinase